MSATSNQEPNIGNFALPSTGNTTFKLDDQRGRVVVVYFYPRDDTPGCTIEGQQFTALSSEFANAGAVVVGVSRDDLASHEAFKAKFGFAFSLLADTEGTLCERFGVMQWKEKDGQKVLGIQRSTFVFDAAGKLVKSWRGVTADGHAAEVLEVVKAL